MAARKKKAAAKHKAAAGPAGLVKPSPALIALVQQRRDELEASTMFIRERVRAQEQRLARIRAEAIAANPPAKLIIPKS